MDPAARHARRAIAAFVARFGAAAAPRRRTPGYLVLRREDDALVGVFNFSEIVRGAFRSTYLGYYALRAARRQGYMTEGMALALDVAFRKLEAASRRGQHPADQRALARARRSASASRAKAIRAAT